MIPKIIHYCWFGGSPYPEKVQKCIESWKHYLPDYEIMCWNESNFDINECKFAREAYENKKYAFVSDYARLCVLKEYGGIYLDVDIEVIKSFTPILNNKMVIALEERGEITGAMIASEPGFPILDEMIDVYISMDFVLADGSFNMVVNNIWMQDILANYGYQKKNIPQKLANEIVIYPDDYFQAKSLIDGKLNVTSNTYCIHHHTLLWVSKKTLMIRFIRMKILVPILGSEGYQKFVKKIRKGKD